jgi:anti-sigma B factor antagonist
VLKPSHLAVCISTGSCARIAVSGELDLASVPAFQAAVGCLELPCRRRTVLDLSRLAFIDVAGLRAVLDMHAQCLNAASALTIVPGPRNVQRVFELTGADRLLPFEKPEERTNGSR